LKNVNCWCKLVHFFLFVWCVNFVHIGFFSQAYQHCFMIYHFKLTIGDNCNWVTIFGQRIQGLCFCYLLNTKFTWNKFKCKILNNLNHTNFHGGGDFSHMYVIMHQYFVKKLEMQKLNTSNFTNNLTCFFAWLLLYMLSTLGAIKYKFSEYKKSTKWK